jgi:hypothetical protein
MKKIISKKIPRRKTKQFTAVYISCEKDWEKYFRRDYKLGMDRVASISSEELSFNLEDVNPLCSSTTPYFPLATQL